MTFTETPLAGSYIIDPVPFGDERGWFARTYCGNEFAALGLDKEWVQINHSFTRHAGTIRGMHYQLPPFAETKFIRCVAGAVYDVIVDIREGSPSFLQHTGVELSATNRKMIYVPEGFAHGFQALTDNAELIYHHSAFYTAGYEGGIRFDDPMIHLNWPLGITVMSDRDKNHPLLTESFKGIKL
ncbi:MAG: dTDP-4-dehydrorhamnose 3,5-epimerase [Bacteroidetes bacterium]|nr:dTDP-4-dehydrorhamnose 3,5-epimerase [Bacteroidota bacterium]